MEMGASRTLQVLSLVQRETVFYSLSYLVNLHLLSGGGWGAPGPWAV